MPLKFELCPGRMIGGNHPCFIIAEIGQNHQGDIEIAKKMIKMAKDCGADCAKFQKSELEYKFNKKALQRPYTSKQSWGKTYGEHKRHLEFSHEQYKELQKYAEEVGIFFTASGMDEMAVEFLHELNVPFFKVGSGDTNNFPYLVKTAKKGRPMVVSSGMQSMETMRRVYKTVKEHNQNFAILQCTSAYPLEAEDVNLRVITEYQKEFPDIPIGYSGHESGICISVAAVTLGAKVIERHITLDKTWKGSDHEASLVPSELAELVRSIRLVERALGSGLKQMLPCEKPCHDKLGKSVVAKVKIPKGTVLTLDMLTVKVAEPMGVVAEDIFQLVGKTGLRLRKKNVETPYVVVISLLEGHVSPSEGQSTEMAAVTTERWYMAPGVQRIEIRQNGVVGTLFLPPGPGPFPAMLDLWGMGGGLVEYRSALFASRGYASLSLAYIGHKELPAPQNRINVGNSYFESAFHLLQDHRQVCADRIGLIGLSFGVYLTLRIATQTVVKPSCLICINGPVGSTIKLSDADGMTEDFESDQKYWTYDDEGHVSFRDVSLPANISPESKVKLEDLTCPLMYIVGEDDLSASSIENANMIEETLRAAGKSQLFTRLSYPGAGHLIEPPYTPNSRASLWSIKPQKRITLWGGHLAPHAAAQEDAWKKILDFMENNLRR